MREFQHEPTIEIGKAQEAPKLSQCGWGWLVMDDLEVNSHIQKTKCAHTEERFRICTHLRREKMCIYRSQNAHIRKRASVYAHFGFRICLFWIQKSNIH